MMIPQMVKSISTLGWLALASNIHPCVPGEQKEGFNDSTQDKITCGWRRPAGDPRGMELLGFVGQTDHQPFVDCKNPHIEELIASGHKLSKRGKWMDTTNKNYLHPTTSSKTRLQVNRSLTRSLTLGQGRETFDMQHELTRKSVEKFAADDRATLSRQA
jgi:hypothetical protein